jgi:hypothetical protein
MADIKSVVLLAEHGIIAEQNSTHYQMGANFTDQQVNN